VVTGFEGMFLSWMKTAIQKETDFLATMNYLIIGGNSDIAQDVTTRLLDDGHHVHCLIRNTEQQDALTTRGITVTVGDATSEEDMKQCITEAKEHGEINGLLHCVGSIVIRPPHALNKDAFEEVITTNLTSAFLALSIAGKAMLRQGSGRMVFSSSVAGSLGLVNHEAIAAAKGGIEAMVRASAATVCATWIENQCCSTGTYRYEDGEQDTLKRCNAGDCCSEDSNTTNQQERRGCVSHVLATNRCP
jgi:NAD(P)-dependent dehydrogenase (short-subunit alcohol dehydrogenase family)